MLRGGKEQNYGYLCTACVQGDFKSCSSCGALYHCREGGDVITKSVSKIRPLPYLSPPLGLSERGGAPWRQEAARDRGAWLAGLSQAAGYNLSEGSASRSMR